MKSEFSVGDTMASAFLQVIHRISLGCTLCRSTSQMPTCGSPMAFFFPLPAIKRKREKKTHVEQPHCNPQSIKHDDVFFVLSCFEVLRVLDVKYLNTPLGFELSTTGHLQWDENRKVVKVSSLEEFDAAK